MTSKAPRRTSYHQRAAASLLGWRSALSQLPIDRAGFGRHASAGLVRRQDNCSRRLISRAKSITFRVRALTVTPQRHARPLKLMLAMLGRRALPAQQGCPASRGAMSLADRPENSSTLSRDTRGSPSPTPCAPPERRCSKRHTRFAITRLGVTLGSRYETATSRLHAHKSCKLEDNKAVVEEYASAR